MGAAVMHRLIEKVLSQQRGGFKQLGTVSLWVCICMVVYGQRLYGNCVTL